MKTIHEMGISHAPWQKAKSCGDMVVCDKSHIAISAASRPEDVLLIAAAPDLYEALMEVYEQICAIQAEHDLSHAEGENTCDECYNTVAWISKARAALEKAGGKE